MRKGTVSTKYSIFLWLFTMTSIKSIIGKLVNKDPLFAESWKDSGRNLSKHSDFNIGGWNGTFFSVHTIYVLYLLPEHTLEIAESLSDGNDETNTQNITDKKEDSLCLHP